MSNPGILAALTILALSGCGASSVDHAAPLVGEWSCERPRDEAGEYRAVERLSADGAAHLTLMGRGVYEGRVIDARVDLHATWARRGNGIFYESDIAPEVEGSVNGDPVPVPQNIMSKFDEWTEARMTQRIVSVNDAQLVFHGKSPDIHWTCKRAALRASTG